MKRKTKKLINRLFLALSTFSFAIFIVLIISIFYDVIKANSTILLWVTGIITGISLFFGFITWDSFKSTLKQRF